MSQSLIYILLLFALVLPVLGAILLRVLGARLSPAQLYSAAGSIFVVVLVSVLLLERSDVPSLQIGALSVLLPVTAPEDISVAIPVAGIPTSDATLEEPTAEPAPTLGAVAVPTELAAPVAPSEATSAAPPTVALSVAPTAAPTVAPTATAAPTAEPTVAPTAAPPPPSEPRKYTVEPGDTLRSIAEKYNVSVTALVVANKLTPQEADSLRVGQELVIPAS